jgi:hypothetical protein
MSSFERIKKTSQTYVKKPTLSLMIATKQTKSAKADKTRRSGGISPKILAFADRVMAVATSSPVRGYYVPMGLRKHSGDKALAS